MPISPLTQTPDPYASLAWSATRATLVLEKLKNELPVSDEEAQVLRTLSERLERFARGSGIGEEWRPFGRGRAAFFTLLAIEQSAPDLDLPSFQETGEGLAEVVKNVVEGRADVDKPLVEITQQRCGALLKQLNARRPGFATF